MFAFAPCNAAKPRPYWKSRPLQSCRIRRVCPPSSSLQIPRERRSGAGHCRWRNFAMPPLPAATGSRQKGVRSSSASISCAWMRPSFGGRAARVNNHSIPCRHGLLIQTAGFSMNARSRPASARWIWSRNPAARARHLRSGSMGEKSLHVAATGFRPIRSRRGSLPNITTTSSAWPGMAASTCSARGAGASTSRSHSGRPATGMGSSSCRISCSRARNIRKTTPSSSLRCARSLNTRCARYAIIRRWPCGRGRTNSA